VRNACKIQDARVVNLSHLIRDRIHHGVVNEISRSVKSRELTKRLSALQYFSEFISEARYLI
jgi:hypothetical protein